VRQNIDNETEFRLNAQENLPRAVKLGRLLEIVRGRSGKGKRVVRKR
jgi:hypothetical protein